MTGASSRRDILRRMGVDVWLVRGVASDPLAKLSSPPALPSVEVGELPPAVRSAPEAPLPERKQVAPAPSAPGLRTLAPFSVLCLTKGDVLLLLVPPAGKAARRFALDLLSAASGIWGGEVTQLTFDWPQPGIENDAETLRKALTAFVEKQVADHDGGLTLVGAEVAEHLPRVPEDSLLLPPLEPLMTRGELKRALWAEIESRRGG